MTASTARKHNAITFDALVNATHDTLTHVSCDEVILLQDDITARVDLLKRDKALLENLVSVRFKEMAELGYRSLAKDTGTVKVSIDERFVLHCARTKTVAWNQDGLAALYDRIMQSGDRADTYIKRDIVTTYSVPENSYKLWSADIQAAFAPYRSVKAGETKITLEEKDK